MDLKSNSGRALAIALAERADALIEGFRPGVMERLGLGPDALLARNPKLVYGRMTGYGQDGPMALTPGHDINYVSLSGVLGASQRVGEKPMFAINTVGDYGGGAVLMAFGVVCALLEARTSGRGQIVDAAMVDGSALLLTMVHALRAAGSWSDQPGTNVLDSGAHFYEVYVTADGGHVAVGAIEPQFYARLLELLELPAEQLPQWDRERWPEFKERFSSAVRLAPGRRVGGATRVRGGLCDRRARAVRRAPAPAHGGEGHVHRARRRTPAWAGATLQPHPRSGAGGAAGSAGGPRTLGHHVKLTGSRGIRRGSNWATSSVAASTRSRPPARPRL